MLKHNFLKFPAIQELIKDYNIPTNIMKNLAIKAYIIRPNNKQIIYKEFESPKGFYGILDGEIHIFKRKYDLEEEIKKIENIHSNVNKNTIDSFDENKEIDYDNFINNDLYVNHFKNNDYLNEFENEKNKRNKNTNNRLKIDKMSNIEKYNLINNKKKLLEQRYANFGIEIEYDPQSRSRYVEIIEKKLYKGSIFGIEDIAFNCTRDSYAKAVTDTLLFYIPKKVFDETIAVRILLI